MGNYVAYNRTISSQTSVGGHRDATTYQVTTTDDEVTVSFIPIEGATPLVIGVVAAGASAQFTVKAYQLLLTPSGATEVSVIGF